MDEDPDSLQSCQTPSGAKKGWTWGSLGLTCLHHTTEYETPPRALMLSQQKYLGAS